ncbi:MAG: four helix bundle protein [Ignavibacteriae bacterium]|nr:four helix bundle protein [Ignavibacteriota bacterium]NOG98090.1 four helix bundle protein [Ignavibacteriota bacterium]
MTVKSFEDLTIWKDARSIVGSIYLLTQNDLVKKDFGFKDQLQRAAVSIMNNISEGFERDNNKEFIRFLSYAKGSAGEVRSMLYIALDLKYINKSEFDKLYKNCISLIKKIAKLIDYLKTKI